MKQYCLTCGRPVQSEAENLLVCEGGHQTWINPLPGSTVCVMKGDEVLYVRRALEPRRGKLDLPGGFCELHERAEETAVREVKEELGIEVELTGFVGSYPSFYPDGRATLNLLYVAAD